MRLLNFELGNKDVYIFEDNFQKLKIFSYVASAYLELGYYLLQNLKAIARVPFH